MIEVLMYIALIALAAPVVVYLVVRLGVYAALMSIHRFRQNHPDSCNPEKKEDRHE